MTRVDTVRNRVTYPVLSKSSTETEETVLIYGSGIENTLLEGHGTSRVSQEEDECSVPRRG